MLFVGFLINVCPVFSSPLLCITIGFSRQLKNCVPDSRIFETTHPVGMGFKAGDLSSIYILRLALLADATVQSS